MRRWGLALTAIVGCTSDRVFDPVEVDIAANCDRAEVVVTYPNLDSPDRPWTRFIAAAADAPGLRRAWALVEFDGDDGVGRLGLWHLNEEEVDARVTLDLPPNEADTLQLQPGATAGVAWLVRRPTPDSYYVARIERITDDDVSVVQSGDFGFFPPVSSSTVGCDEDMDGVPEPCDVRTWPKQLAIVDGVPFIVATPTSSLEAVTYAFVGRLSETLALTELSELQFTRQCDINAPLEELAFCTDQNERTSYPEIVVAGAQGDPTRSAWSMFLLREAALDGIPELREPVVITIGLTEGGSPQGVLRAQSGEATADLKAIIGPPWGLAVDEFYTYLLHATARDGPRLARVSTSFEDIVGLELSDDIQLLQLEGDVALGDVDGATWSITKLFPDAPERSQTTTYVADSPIRRLEPSGPGSFLIHEEDGGPTLISLSCAASG